MLPPQYARFLTVVKAQRLRGRVRSYRQRQKAGSATRRIRGAIDRLGVEYTLTDSIGEALALEANLSR